MHDNTNFGRLPKLSGAELNTATWSKYYAMNTSKAGVTLQKDGFTRAIDPYTSTTPDTTYVTGNRILEDQKEFDENDNINGKIIPFTNIFDKEYRLTMECLKHNQLCW